MTYHNANPKPGKKKNKGRDPELIDLDYQAFIRSQPCLICGSFESQHHHESLSGGTMGGKCSDRESLPLCSICHTWSCKSRHRLGRYSFFKYHGIPSFRKEVLKYQKLYDERVKK